MSRFLVALTTLLLLGASSAHALVQRAYVSALTGNDSNTATNCQATAPCRWFAGAISVVSSGGEIVAMDSGAYGTVTITKSIAIVSAPGVYAGITVFSGDGIIIATAGIDVVLRGLTINGLGGDNGVHMSAGNSLTMQNCAITNFTTTGLYVSGSSRVRLLDSLLRGNGNGAYFLHGPRVLVSGSRFLDNTYIGLRGGASGAGVVTRVEVNRSEASGNTLNAGFYANADTGGRTEFNLKDSNASRNAHGVETNSDTGAALARVSNSLISGNTSDGLYAHGSGAKLVAAANRVTDNGVGLLQSSSATFQSTGDNTVTDNTTNFSGTIASLANM
ncbi:MAG: hypothetical protein F9K47_09860 [Burkholderiales bacterium]|nr:MAG: hypothetical protein F9K47_09860 [Burkholderiales bacterium]